MRSGRTVPAGFLPVYSVDTEEEARLLIVMTCPRTDDGSAHFARELAAEQTLENLGKFAERVALAHQRLREARAVDEGG